MRWLLIVALLVSLGLNAGLAWRLGRQETPERRPGWSAGETRGHALRDTSKWRGYLERRLDRMQRDLDLTDDQVQAFRTLHGEAHGLGRRFHVVETGRRQVFEGIAAGEITPDSVRSAMAGLSRRQAAIDSLIVDKMLQEMAILTPEQRPEYLRMLPMERFGGRRTGGRGRDGGKDGHGPRGEPPDEPRGDGPGGG